MQNLFTYIYLCLKMCPFSFHTEVTRFPKRTSQVAVWWNRFYIPVSQYVLAFLVPAAASWSETAWVYMIRLINEMLCSKQCVFCECECAAGSPWMQESPPSILGHLLFEIYFFFPPSLLNSILSLQFFPPWWGTFKAFSHKMTWAATKAKHTSVLLCQ